MASGEAVPQAHDNSTRPFEVIVDKDKALGNLMMLLQMLGRYHMHPTYALLLALARSSRHLEELHLNLPENQRLLRADFIKLRECWQAMGVEGGSQLGFPWTAALLDNVKWHGNRHNLTRYYADVLDNGREEVPSELIEVASSRGHRVLSCVERTNHGFKHFLIRIAGYQFKLACAFVEAAFIIRITTTSDTLTEPLTYKLLSIPGLRQAKIVSGFENHIFQQTYPEVNFYFIVENHRFNKLGALTAGIYGDDSVANSDIFLPELARILKELKVPFEAIMAIVPWSEQCVPGTELEEGAYESEHHLWGGITR